MHFGHGNSPTLVFGQSFSINFIILDFCSYSKKAIEDMVLTQKSCRVQDFD